MPQKLSQLPLSVDRIDIDDIQVARPQLGLDESLGAIPGLFMQNRYNYAQDLRISIRGFGSRASFGIRGIKLLVDGIPETLPDGQSSVDSIDLGSIESIEVIRGPASALYGNASGGVINIFTEKSNKPPTVELSSATGSYGYRKNQVKSSGNSGSFNYLVNAAHLDLEGYREQSKTRNTVFNSRISKETSTKGELTATFSHTDQPNAEDPGGINDEQVRLDRKSARDNNLLFDAGEALSQTRVGLAYRHKFSEQNELVLRQYVSNRRFDGKLPFSSGGAIDLERLFYGAGILYRHDWFGESVNYRLTTGVDYDYQDDERKRFDNLFGQRGNLTLNQDEHVQSLGIFVLQELTIVDRWLLSIGLRFDDVDFDVDDSFLSDGNDSGNRNLQELSPSAGLTWSLNDALNVYASIADSFETPTTTELANPDGGGFNPNLEPQNARNYEIGVKGFWTTRLRYALAVFRIDVDNELIAFQIPSSPGRDFFENTGSSRRDGLEFSLQARLSSRISAKTAYTYSDFIFKDFFDGETQLSGNHIPGIPEQQWFTELKYQSPKTSIMAIESVWVDDIYLDNANQSSDKDYLLVNVRASWNMRTARVAMEPFVSITNLFDRNYNANLRVNAFGDRFFEPGPGRAIFIGIKIRHPGY